MHCEGLDTEWSQIHETTNRGWLWIWAQRLCISIPISECFCRLFFFGVGVGCSHSAIAQHLSPQAKGTLTRRWRGGGGVAEYAGRLVPTIIYQLFFPFCVCRRTCPISSCLVPCWLLHRWGGGRFKQVGMFIMYLPQ